MSDMAMEVVLNKVKKLFALSQSSNEHEAALAIEKAHALLKEYNLSMSDITEDSKYGIEEKEVLVAVNESMWKTLIIMGVAEANYCLSLKRRFADGRYAQVLVGKPHNMIVAKEMVDYLISTVDRLCKILPAKERVSYKNGIATTLLNRLRDTLNKDTEECTALVIQEKAMIDNYLSDKGVTTREVSIVSRNTSAYYKGVRDGNNVSLHNQVGATKPVNAIV